ncbi:hypothetical protein N431DRAFT_414351 [Stipitochalara longipes BDJ]|nr:hypothetical protein N431DRAFT_414351 [Stipitochalara longipes BDJ]
MLDLSHHLVRGRQKGKSGSTQQAGNGILPLSEELLNVTRPQTQSSILYKLPLEIRLIIYSCIFPKDVDTVHVEWRFPRLLPPGLRKNKTMVNGLGKWHHSRCGVRIWLDSDRSTRPKCDVCIPTWRETPKIPLDIALLFVCRQIYSEAIHVFYSSLTLQMYSGPTLRKFVTSVPAQYLASVRNVWFDWCLGGKELPHTSTSALLAYAKTWDNLHSFSELKVLCVTLESRLDHRPLPPDIDFKVDEAWLAPLERFSGLERCDITVGPEFQEIFRRLKGEKCRVLEAPRTINQSTGKPYRSCRSCGMTHGSVENSPQWVSGGWLMK